MTSKFSDFAAHLRERFLADAAPTKIPQDDTDEDDFNGFALQLFALQYKANLSYRQFCEARGVTSEQVEHWTHIPTMPAAGFKECELSCLPAAMRTAVFYSSGTTAQQRSRHFHSPESLQIYEVSLWTWFRTHVLANEERKSPPFEFIALTPPPIEESNSSLVHMFDCVRRKLAAPETAFVGRTSADGAWMIDFDAALAALNSKRESGNAKLIVGTAFSFVHLLDSMEEHNIRVALPDGSRVMETGGYKGRSRSMPKSELHSTITGLLGVPASQIICEYGMSELSSQAYDGAIGLARNSQHTTRDFHFPPWARAQVISPETGREVANGETGLLRIFDLANVWSVMAIQTEDLAIRRGDGFELLGRAELAESRGCSLMSLGALSGSY